MPHNLESPSHAASRLCGNSPLNDDVVTLPVDAISGSPLEPEQACLVRDLKPGLADYLLREYPSLKPSDYIDKASIEDLRRQYVIDVLREDKGELTTLESEVAESIATRETLAENTELEYYDSQDFGGRVADWVARVGGSWAFIIFFGSFLAIWMLTNVVLGTHEAFDAYPFVLLNLVLSTIAAFQAPVIMMSQRRQEAKDRLRATNDYQVNLKAELEIRRLHEKIDHLISRQWKKLDEMQSHVTALSRGSENHELAGKGRRLASRGKKVASVREPFIASPEEPSL